MTADDGSSSGRQLQVVHPNASASGPDTEKISRLLKEMKQTKGARFNAAKRLESRDRRRTNLVAYASVGVIFFTVVPLFFTTEAWVTNLLSLATMSLSITILAYSLLQGQDNDLVKADQFHRCAMEINELRRKLRTKHDSTPKFVEDCAREFDGILRRYNLNHDPTDRDLYKLEHPDEFPNLTSDQKENYGKPLRTETALNIATNVIPPAIIALLITSMLFNQEFKDAIKMIFGTD